MLELSEQDFDRLFPFHVRLDQRGALLGLGSSLRRALPGAEDLSTFDELVRVRRPKRFALATLASKPEAYGMVLLEVRGSALVLRGQITSLDAGRSYCFLGSPWVPQKSDMSRLGLQAADFARHDPTVDLVLMLGTLQASLGQARELRHELEARQESLEAATREARAADRAKGEFLATMSHEIRTPLNGVIGMTGVLLSTGLDPVQRDYARIIHNSGEALLRLLNDILDFSKIDADRVELEEVPFCPGELVEDALELLREEAGRRNLELGAILAPDLPATVAGDAGRLRQVLVNLLGNAVKFTRHGGVVVRMGARPSGPGGHGDEDGVGALRLDVEVTDTGIGIPPEALAIIFEPFRQADGSTTRRFGGTGLGLAISRRLVELMDGALEVESEVEAGTTFRFHVRLRACDGAARGMPRVPGAGELALLAVDDSEIGRRLLRHQLERHVQRLELFAGGQLLLTAAASWGERCPFDLAILDQDMPGMDGVELARRIRATPWGRRLPLLLLSSADDPSGRRSARDAGIDLVLPKPARQRQLLAELVALIGDAPAPPRTSATSFELLPDSLTSLRILIAEDNPVNQRVAQAMLRRLGCKADVVTNGLEALSSLERQPYDLVLMDCQMPELDGFEATRRIRRREQGERRTTIVALTANVLQGDREACLEAGMDDYLSKPVRLGDLRRGLERWFDLDRGAPPRASA